MARITIDLNTSEDGHDIDVLRAVADSFYRRPPAEAAEEEGERPLARHTEDAEAAPVKRTRRTKAQIAADTANAQSVEQDTKPESGSTTNGAGHGPDAAETVTLAQVNGRLNELISSGTPALKLQELVKAATDGKYGSANKADAAGDQDALNAIWAGLEAL